MGQLCTNYFYPLPSPPQLESVGDGQANLQGYDILNGLTVPGKYWGCEGGGGVCVCVCVGGGGGGRGAGDG